MRPLYHILMNIDIKLLISISHNCSLLILLSPSRNFLICPYAFHFGKSQKEILRCKTAKVDRRVCSLLIMVQTCHC